MNFETMNKKIKSTQRILLSADKRQQFADALKDGGISYTYDSDSRICFSPETEKDIDFCLNLVHKFLI